MFNGLVCTEVLEHVQNYQKLIDEMYRVMRERREGIHHRTMERTLPLHTL
jgi:ubiquinone/menaquinone biosynthesis C-methylase UbiE